MGETSEGAVAIPLAEDVDVHCGMSEFDGSVELGIRHRDELVDKVKIAPEDGPKPLKLDIGPVEFDFHLGADNGSGEFEVSGRLKWRQGDDLKTVVDIDQDIFRYAPAHGSIGGDREPHPPIFKDPRFGESKMSSKNVTRMYVDEHRRFLADVGRHVKKDLWDDYPDWIFNTVACVGAFDDAGRGSYSDPTSIWFNVFLGYYQIDAPKQKGWTRPFAYETADGAASRMRPDEIVRLGKSDWNYFSNWMYGVPPDRIATHNDFDMNRIETSQGTVVIGGRTWHQVSIAGVDFVSVYESDHPDAERLVHNSVLSKLWRKAFGLPDPRPDHTESFVGTSLDADMYISYWEDDEAFHTAIFGGTAPQGAAPAFLERQLDAAGRVIAESYPKLGFKNE